MFLTLGSITRRCSENEPALLPRMHGWTREGSFVSLIQSDNRPQSFVGHELSRQFGLQPKMADDVGFCPGVRVHKGITIILSLFRSHWLAVV